MYKVRERPNFTIPKEFIDVTGMEKVTLERFISEKEASKKFLDAVSELEKDGIRYLIGGMISVNCLLGKIRDTKDIDVFFSIDELKSKEDTPLKIFVKHGFSKVVYEEMGPLHAETLRLNKLSIHLSYPTPKRITETVFDKQKKDGVFLELMGKKLPAMPIEETLFGKLIEGPGKHLEDARMIMERLKSFDVDYIVQRFSECIKKQDAEYEIYWRMHVAMQLF
jgi:hypothetical protein